MKKQNDEKDTIVQRILTILNKIWEDMEDDSKAIQNLKYFIRLIESSIRKFLVDEGMLRATSISYSLIVSFVPLLVVALLVGAKFINIDEYFFIAREFVRKNGIPLELDQYFEIIKELLANANAISFVGFLILIFSATSILRNIENAMNTIWMVRKGRPWVQKIGGFILVLIFGPVIMAVGISFAQSLVNMASAPGIVELKKAGVKQYALGEKATILKRTADGEWQNQRLAQKVDFDAQKKTVIFNTTQNRNLNDAERGPLLPRMEKALKSTLQASSVTDIAQVGGSVLAVTTLGEIIFHDEESDLYDIRRYQRENVKLLFNVTFNRIEMFNQWEGVIIGEGGLILRTDNGGLNWRPAYQEAYKLSWNDIVSIDGSVKIIVGDNFQSMISRDGGMTWAPNGAIEKLAGRDRENLHSIFAIDNHVWAAGDFGTLLHSKDKGATWVRAHAGITKADFHDIAFLDSERGIIVGEKGLLKYTDDGGETWRLAPVEVSEDLYTIDYDASSGRIFVGGEDYIILEADASNIANFSVTLRSPFWRKMVTATGNLFLPFLVIGLIFFMAYKVLPYTFVNNRAALTGAAVTSLLWVIFLIVYKFYLTSFTKGGTFAIYGTLAAIPLTLLLVYTSVSIMLYGAEIAFFVQNPMVMSLTRKDMAIEKENRAIWYGMRMLYVLYQNFEKGRGETAKGALVSICGNDHNEFERIMGRYIERDFVRKISETGYAPIAGPSNIKLFELVEQIDPSDYNIPGYVESDPFMASVRKYFDSLAGSRKEILDGLTFEDLLRSQS